MNDGHIRQPSTWHGYVWSFLTRSSTVQARKKEGGLRGGEVLGKGAMRAMWGQHTEDEEQSMGLRVLVVEASTHLRFVPQGKGSDGVAQ